MKLLFSKKEKTCLFVILFGGVCICLAGICSDIFLGDETFHYRFASHIYETKSRPIYDPLTGCSEQGKIFYVVEPLWHTGLAIAWAITGGISKVAAQIYHTLFFVFLLISTYLLAKELYEPKRALYSMLLVGSVPLLVALSIIFHLDMPVTALITFCFLMLVKKKYFWAGLFLGLSFLCKRNVLFLFPAIIGNVLLADKQPLKRKLIHLFLLGSIFILVISPDVYFRVKSFGMISLLRNIPLDWCVSPIEGFSKPSYPSKLIPYDYSNILSSPRVLVRDLGPLLIASVGIYLLRKKYSRKELLLLFTILSYIFFCIIFFWPILSLRYFFPIVPFLAVLGSGSLVSLKRKWLKYILISVFITQFYFVAGYIFLQRRIPAPVKQAYDFVKEKTPADAAIMCTKNALALHTNRIAMWSSYASLAEMPYLLWNSDEKEALEILKKYKIGYVFVEKDRIYDDKNSSHLGGYPQSFLGKLSIWSSFNLIFDNKAVCIWKIEEN